MSKRTLSTLLSITLLLAAFTYILLKPDNKPPEKVIYKQNINEQMIIKRLHSQAKLVVLEGDINKTYGKSDDWFNSKWDLFNSLGQKHYVLKAKGTFLMGIDLRQITEEDVQLNQSTLHIDIPDPKLMSVNIPYENILINEKDGLFRKEFSVKEKQAIHKEMSKAIKNDILRSNEISEKAYEESILAMDCFLRKLPGVTDVIIN